MAQAYVYEDSVNGWIPMVYTSLGASGVVAGTYGDATHVSQVTVSTEGIVTAASDVAISGAPPTGAAGGDLAGTYPNPSVKALTETSGPTDLVLGAIPNGDFLKRSGGTIVGAAAVTSAVSDIDGITGSVTLVAGTNVTITDNSPVAGDIKIDAATGSGGGLGVYGDGSDGSPTFDGTTTLLGIVPNPNSNVNGVYTLTRDIFLASGTLNSGIGIDTNGFRIFCQGTFTNNGLIQWNGGSVGDSGLGGAASSNTNSTINSGSTTTSPGTSGGSGTSTTGGNGTASTLTNYGGRGGTGGTGPSGAGGSGGTVTAQAVKMTPPRFLPLAVIGQIYTGDATRVRCSGGTGGGGGGGDGSANNGGGGGGGGGVVVVAARAFAGTGAIQARGGNGGTRTAGSNGGGGGGGGGLVIVISGSVSAGAIAGQTIDANGGTKGSPHGTGTNNATDGNGGTVILIPN